MLKVARVLFINIGIRAEKDFLCLLFRTEILAFSYAYQPSHFPIIEGKDTLSNTFVSYRKDLALAHDNMYRARAEMSRSYNRKRATSFTIAT
jgi:hypothetical protein